MSSGKKRKSAANRKSAFSNALKDAILSDCVTTVRNRLAAGDDLYALEDIDGELAGTVLHYAVSSQCNVLQYLLQDHHIEVNTVNAFGETLLYTATNWDCTSNVSLLLQFGANPNIANNHGITPLMKAAQHNSLKNAEALFQAGASLSAVDTEGCTALDYAESSAMKKLLKLFTAIGVKSTLESKATDKEQQQQQKKKKKTTK